MTRYELLHEELKKIRIIQFALFLTPAVIIGTVVGNSVKSTFPVGISITIIAIAIFGSAFLFHQLWRVLFLGYARLCVRANTINSEIRDISKKVDSRFSKYRERVKGEQFKKAYRLSGKALYDLEEALSVGMNREDREIFVTSFIRKGVAVRVTASMGSPYRCSPADSPGKWKYHYERLGCDQIRQYHNHSVHNGKTRPSYMDYKTSKVFENSLKGIEFRSFIICWNAIREWKIIEYNGSGKFWLFFEFDSVV